MHPQHLDTYSILTVVLECFIKELGIALGVRELCPNNFEHNDIELKLWNYAGTLKEI